MLSVDIRKKGFGGKIILKDIKFSLEKGQSLLVLAPSGAGKTTLIRAILGQTKYDGKITCDSESIGYISQKNILDERETVYSSVLYTAKLANPHTKETELSILSRSKLKNLGLGHLMNQKIEKLSGGQQRRTQIAQQLVQNSSLIIADEADSGLDALSGNLLLQDLCSTARKEGRTVIVISHNIIRENLNLFSRILILAKTDNNGAASIAYYGSPQQVYTYFREKSMLKILQSIQTKSERGLGKGDYFVNLYKNLSTTQKIALEIN